MSGQPTKRDVENWANELQKARQRIGHHFARVEPRKRAIGYLRGLLSETERKNGWQLAEYLGEATPHAVQHLFGRADWDADAGRDDSGRVDSRGRDTLADGRVSVVGEGGMWFG